MKQEPGILMVLGISFALLAFSALTVPDLFFDVPSPARFVVHLWNDFAGE